MAKVIIYEGLDNCLKTTMVNEFIKYVNYNSYLKSSSYNIIKTFQVLKYSAPPKLDVDYNGFDTLFQEKVFEKMFNTLEFFQKNNIDVILDRSHLGDNVYSKLYRNKGMLTENSLERIKESEQKYLKNISYMDILNDHHVFVFYDDIEYLLKRNDGKNLSDNEENIKEELKQFKEIDKHTLIPNVHYINLRDFSISDNPDKIDTDKLSDFIFNKTYNI